jgi:hypothetical protein
MKDFNTKLTEYCMSKINFDSISKTYIYTRYTFVYDDDVAYLLHWKYREYPYSLSIGFNGAYVRPSLIPKILAEKLGYERTGFYR